MSLTALGILGGAAARARFGVQYAILGAVSATGFAVSVRTAVDTDPITLDASPDPTFATGVVSGAAGAALTASNDRWAKLTVTGLSPATRYFWRVRRSDNAIGSRAGECRTYAAGAQSFSMAFGSCNDQGEDPITWLRIAARAPTFVLHMGDLHYGDVETDSLPLNVQYQHEVLGRERHSAVIGALPLVYQPNDHDSGTNGIGLPVYPAVQTVYRRIWPHYAIPGTGWYQAFTIGRVRIIVLDTRSFASSSGDADSALKTMLGATQQTWLEGELLAAKNAGQAIVLAVGTGWVGNTFAINQDGWYSFQFARALILDYLVAQAIPRVTIIHGDMHGIAVDNGAFNTAQRASLTGNLLVPVYGGAPFQAGGSSRGGPWSNGSFGTSGADRRQYGMLTFTDTGGSTMDIRFDGYRCEDHTQPDVPLVTHSRTVTL